MDEAGQTDAIEALDLPESRWVDVDGPVHYKRWDGPADGPTFVLVHGLGGSILNWALVAPDLSARGTVLALDLSGFGLTPSAGRGSAIGTNAKVLDGFLRALGLPPVVLVGNSMGGMLTLIQTAHHPDTVDRMILVDAAYPRASSLRSQVSPRIAVRFLAISNPAVGRRILDRRNRRLGPSGVIAETLKVCTVEPSSVDPGLVAALVELTDRRQRSGASSAAYIQASRSLVRSQIRPAGYRALVRAIPRPALVIHGEKDRLVPVAGARREADEHPNWDLQVFHDLGHLPMMEAPGRWLDAVGRWLDGDGSDMTAMTATTSGADSATPG